MELLAYAKINWSLDIVGVREDGYHIMDMLMEPVSVADEISLKKADGLHLSVSGYPPVKADQSNLAYRAADALRKAAGVSYGASIHVHKAIPVGAGMGGGSSDAAAVLMGLNRLWGIGLPDPELEKIGLGLGADVPFFIRGGLTRTGGIGELLESRECYCQYRMIIIQPCPGLSTAQVFSLWKDGPDVVHPRTDDALHALETGDLRQLCCSIGNVLRPVAGCLRPSIDRSCADLMEQGASVAEMTGSGSAVFGVFSSPAAAQKAYNALRPRYRTIFLCHTQHDSVRWNGD